MLPKQYIDFLEHKGKSLQDIGINGFALDRVSTLEALGILRKNSIPVSGGDVLRAVGETIRHTYDNWYVQPEKYKSHEEYVSNSIAIAEKFIRDYKDSEDGSIFYLLVVPEHTVIVFT